VKVPTLVWLDRQHKDTESVKVRVNAINKMRMHHTSLIVKTGNNNGL